MIKNSCVYVKIMLGQSMEPEQITIQCKMRQGAIVSLHNEKLIIIVYVIIFPLTF